MQARELDAMWEAFDAAAIAERTAQASTVRAVAALLEHLPAPAVASEIVERCQVTYTNARALVAEADELRSLPAIAEASGDGRLSSDQVAALRVLANPETERSWLDALHFDLNGELTITHLVAEARKEKVRQLTERDGGRFMRARSTPDERFVDVRTRLYPEESAAMMRKLDSLVPRGTHPDDFDTARVDALMHLVTDGGGVKATVLVAASRPTVDGTGDDPGVLRSTGAPVPAAVVRQLAAEGKVLTVERPSHAETDGIPEANRRYVWSRDRSACRRPGGCTAPPSLLDIHHIRGRDVPDPHHPSNMLLLCKPHHRDMQRGWRIEGDAEGDVTWIRPDDSVHDPPPVIRARPPNLN